MIVVWLVVGGAAVAFVAVAAALRRDYRDATRGWRMLAIGGAFVAVGGLGFAVRFWEPTRGPYLANQVYPFGPYLNAWAVSFGFTWLAFGLLFIGLALLGARQPSARLWLALFVSWILCWLPHGVIGVAFALAGHNEPSVQLYRQWGSGPVGLLRVSANALILVAHFGFTGVGFLLSGRELWHQRQAATHD